MAVNSWESANPYLVSDIAVTDKILQCIFAQANSNEDHCNKIQLPMLSTKQWFSMLDSMQQSQQNKTRFVNPYATITQVFATAHVFRTTVMKHSLLLYFCRKYITFAFFSWPEWRKKQITFFPKFLQSLVLSLFLSPSVWHTFQEVFICLLLKKKHEGVFSDHLRPIVPFN